jgi:phosphoribosyl-ATP pyrophosphohydrolase/phosphoribosyl-AMP cyclohydrolase
MKSIDVSTLAWDKMNGLIPAIIQNSQTGVVLMLGYMSRETLQMTIDTQRVTFYSRSKNRPWVKGETSGHYLKVSYITADCDFDTLLIFVDPVGSTCHEGSESCFGDSFQSDLAFIAQLTAVMVSRNKQRPANSYTADLFNMGVKRIAQKVGEEAVEVALAAVAEDKKGEFYEESADLLFHWLVLLESKQSNIFNVLEVLKKRHREDWNLCQKKQKPHEIAPLK